ncbi:tetratricopeptide repeat protein [Rhodoplanes sp. Z2-YC6860]|uniref:tetratricopeptide repeat protein n=1 Tax=Rhodoplanes sp. Z2-YC6860 TaxID=674703 RepID=UPI00078C0303|nr:hypothetical protein [Rhodoplanes sp. Z2-YC6860]AMN43729.1 tetratricopeptide repeat protein [Rhodoplanes sp. Z2-YC6860]
MTTADKDLTAIRSRIESGQSKTAIEELRRFLDAGVAGPDVYRLLAWAYLECQDLDAALASLRQARGLSPSPATELSFARFLNARSHKRAALDCALVVVNLDPSNADALALACMLSADLGDLGMATAYGQKSLEIRDREASTQSIETSKLTRRWPFDARLPHQNIIAFSLFGKEPYYWESAIAAASMAFSIFPEWRCRFYCDSNVPNAVLQALSRLRAEILIFQGQSKNWDSLAWRFLAFDDPNAKVVMVRDVDSPFTLRERFAVDEWLAADHPFHVIRDHHYHCEPMMAGLWGGWTGLLPSMDSLLTKHYDREGDRFSDQRFLRLQVWPRIRAVALVHDRFFNLGTTRRPPSHVTEKWTHIGMAWPRPRRPVPAEHHGEVSTS